MVSPYSARGIPGQVCCCSLENDHLLIHLGCARPCAPIAVGTGFLAGSVFGSELTSQRATINVSVAHCPQRDTAIVTFARERELSSSRQPLFYAIRSLRC